MSKKNPIDEYFAKEGKRGSQFSELFKGNDDFIDQMTELSTDQVINLAVLDLNDRYFMSVGMRPLFGLYSNKFMRLMVSKDRKSRGEYVDVHKANEDPRAGNVINVGGAGKIP